MKDKIFEVINYGNSLLSKGTLLFGLTIKPAQFEVFNLKLRELKWLNIESVNTIKDIMEIEITDYNDLITKEYKNPLSNLNKFALAYWTGDLFFSKQSLIKSYIRNINMKLDFLMHEIY